MFKCLGRKKRAEVNIIGERIEALNNKLWLISTMGENRGVKVEIRYYRDYVWGHSKNYKIFSMDTKLGRRCIAVDRGSLYYGYADLIQYNSQMENCMWGHRWSYDFNYIFNIEVKRNDIAVNLAFDVDMTKEEIDLAILEFEMAIEAIYEDITALQESQKALVNYLKKGKKDD